MVTICAHPQKDQLDTSVPVVVLPPASHNHCIARSLGKLGVPLYGVHADPRSPAAQSRYWQKNFTWNFDEASAEESVDWLLQLSQKIGYLSPRIPVPQTGSPSGSPCPPAVPADNRQGTLSRGQVTRPILIPTGDSSCLFLADNAAALSEGFVFPDQPTGLARALSSKKQMYFLCKKYGVPTPETVFPQCRKDVVEFLTSATFPVMLKCIDNTILDGVDMRVVLVEDARTLLNHFDEMEPSDIPNFMLQEYIPGSSELIWMFTGYFDNRSNCLFGLTGKKMRQYPAYTGSTSLGMCVANEVVTTQTKDFMKALGYRGILDLGYKYDGRTGQYKLLDVNPRIGTVFRLFVDTCGVDVAQVFYRDLTGQSVLTGGSPEGRKWVVENYDLGSSLTLYRDGKLGLGEWIRSLRGVQETSWFAPDDLAPFVMMWRHSLQWVLKRLFTGAWEACSRWLGARRRLASSHTYSLTGE